MIDGINEGRILARSFASKVGFQLSLDKRNEPRTHTKRHETWTIVRAISHEFPWIAFSTFVEKVMAAFKLR